MAGRGAQGSRILHSAGGSTGTFVVIDNVTNIAGPTGQATPIDTTDLLSTGLENVPDLPDYGNVTLDVNWRGTTKQAALYDMFKNRSEAQSFKIALPEDSTAAEFDVLSFDASVVGCNFGAQVRGKQSVQFTLKVSGAVTLTQNVASGSLA